MNSSVTSRSSLPLSLRPRKASKNASRLRTTTGSDWASPSIQEANVMANSRKTSAKHLTQSRERRRPRKLNLFIAIDTILSLEKTHNPVGLGRGQGHRFDSRSRELLD